MKRVGYLYERMALWDNIREAETVATKRKSKNFGVIRHAGNRWHNLIEIQEMILQNRMKTSNYSHEKRISGQNKLRDIAKLHFHPSHIQHQLLTIVAAGRIDKALILHTYASRKGFGQTRAALQLKKYLHKYKPKYYAQGDIIKYYDSIPHDLLRKYLNRLFKDKRFICSFMEPFEKFSNTGKSIPLGIRPSQIAGNLALIDFDRFATEDVKCKGYLRYLDDFIFFGSSKWEVKWKMKRLQKFIENLTFNLHEPVREKVSEKIDMLGYVYNGQDDGMFWRKSDKKRWLKRRAKLTNHKRIRELDDAAWGQLKWGNSDCRRLFHLKTNINRKVKKMGVNFNKFKMPKKQRVDMNGIPFIEAPETSMGIVINKTVEIHSWVKGVQTVYGPNRYVLEIFFMGDNYRLVVNSASIKQFIDDLEEQHVTKVQTVFIDKGSKHYDVDLTRTSILEVNNRKIKESEDGKIVFEDDGSEVQILK